MKKITVYTLLCFASILLMATTCEDPSEVVEIYVENKSGEPIRVQDFSYNDSTLLNPKEAFKIQKAFENEVPHGGIYLAYMSLKELERDQNLQILIFKQSTFDKYTKKELTEKNIYDKLYILSSDDLKACNYRVIYTGVISKYKTDYF